jgi:hypothetical protein
MTRDGSYQSIGGTHSYLLPRRRFERERETSTRMSDGMTASGDAVKGEGFPRA